MRSAAVGKGGPIAAGEDSRHPPMPSVLTSVPDGVHAAVNRHQQPASHAFLDKALAKPGVEQLSSCDQPVLPLGEHPDQLGRLLALRQQPNAFSLYFRENA